MRLNSNLSTHCMGCSACYNICPQNAIEMKANSEGFLYPYINENLCNNCELCLDICPIDKNNKKLLEKSKRVYACQLKDEKNLIEATSGGLFPAIAKEIVLKDGWVFGAAYNKCMKVVHMGTNSVDEIKKFNGSKYVQSNIGDSFQQIKKLLDNDKYVLFSGTPCQVHGLKLFLKKEYKKLLTMDVVCYGVPSPKLFNEALILYEEKYQAKIVDWRFRDKHNNGWSHTTVITFEMKNGETFRIEYENYYDVLYYRAFAMRNCNRKCCYTCPYTSLKRVSDITMGNFWGIEKITNSFNDYNGVSMALINTIKGEEWLDRSRSNLFVEERKLIEAKQANSALFEGVTYPKSRDMVYKSLNKKGFEKMIKKYCSLNWITKFKNRVKSLI